MRRQLTAVLAATSTACTSWHTEPMPAPEPLGKIDFIHIRKTDDAIVDMYAPKVVGDSVVGTVSRKDTTHVAVATKDVKSLQVQKFSVMKTVALVAVIGVTIAVIAGSAGGGQSASSGNSSCNSTKPA